MNPSELPQKESNTPPQDPLSQIGHSSTPSEASREESVAAALCYVPFGALIKT